MQGISIDFLDSGFQAAITGLEVSVNRSGIETTTYSAEALESVAAGLHEVNEINLQIQFSAESEVPITGNPEPILIHWGSTVWLISAFVEAFDYQLPTDSLLTASITLKGASTIYYLQTSPVENDALVDCVNIDGTLIYAG